MAWNIYPTQTPVGSWQGQSCEEQQEYQHAEWLNHLHQSPLHSFRCSGGVFTLGADALDIPSGTYIIDGRVAYNDAADSIAITATRPTYLFARLLKTGLLVTSAEYYVNTNGALPSEPHVLMGVIDTVAGVANTCTPSQVYPHICYGTHTGNGSARGVFLGFQPKHVVVTNADDDEAIVAYPAGPGFASATDAFTYMKPTSTGLPTITAFGFTIPSAFNSAGDDIYWTAWA